MQRDFFFSLIQGFFIGNAIVPYTKKKITCYIYSYSQTNMKIKKQLLKFYYYFFIFFLYQLLGITNMICLIFRVILLNRESLSFKKNPYRKKIEKLIFKSQLDSISLIIIRISNSVKIFGNSMIFNTDLISNG